MTAIRVLIVDDHKLFRDGLSAIFMNVADIEAVVSPVCKYAGLQVYSLADLPTCPKEPS